MVNTTVAGNSAPSSGSGIRADTNGTYLLTNTIISSSGFGGDCFGLGPFTSLGHNLDSDGTCGLAATGDLSGVNTLIGPLADNGGPTLTHALQFGSPAIDAGNNALCSATDQRSAPRPAGAACDMGAYEANSIPLGVVPSVSDWALIALALLLGAGVYIRRRRSSPAPSASLIGLLPVM